MHFTLVSSICIKQKVVLFKVLGRNLLTNSDFREKITGTYSTKHVAFGSYNYKTTISTTCPSTITWIRNFKSHCIFPLVYSKHKSVFKNQLNCFIKNGRKITTCKSLQADVVE